MAMVKNEIGSTSTFQRGNGPNLPRSKYVMEAVESDGSQRHEHITSLVACGPATSGDEDHGVALKVAKVESTTSVIIRGDAVAGAARLSGEGRSGWRGLQQAQEVQGPVKCEGIEANWGVPLQHAPSDPSDPHPEIAAQNESEESARGVRVLPLAPFLSPRDPDATFYNEIYHYVTNGKLPENVHDSYKKTIKKRASFFFVNAAGDGLCYNPRNPKTVVTCAEAQRAMVREAHVDSNGLHNGARKMYLKIFAKYYWRSVYTDVNSYVKNCDKCQEEPEGSASTTIGAAEEQDTLRRQTVWKKVELRIHGPLRRSLQGSEHLATLLDPATGYAVAQALPTHNLEANTASFLLHTFCRNGFPVRCQAVGVSGTAFSNLQSSYTSLRESCADTLRSIITTSTYAEDLPDQLPGMLVQHPREADAAQRWALVDDVIEEVVSRDGLSWDVQVQHQFFRLNVRPGHGGAPSPFALMFGRCPAGGAGVAGAAEPEAGPPQYSRRRLRSSTLLCRHCDNTFTSKISFRIHQRKHTEDARRRGVIEGEVQTSLVPDRKSLMIKKKKKNGQRVISLLKDDAERQSNSSSNFSVTRKREELHSLQGSRQQCRSSVQIQQQQPQQRVVQHQVISHNLQQHSHLQQQQQPPQLDHQSSIQLHLSGSSLQQSHQPQHQSLPITTVLHHTNHLHEPVNAHHQDHHHQQGLQHHHHHVFPQQQAQHQQNGNIHVSLQPSHQIVNINEGSMSGIMIGSDTGDTATIEVIHGPNEPVEGQVITIDSPFSIHPPCIENKSAKTFQSEPKFKVENQTEMSGSCKLESSNITASTVAAVKNLLMATKDERGLRGKYTRYSAETREEIARFALVHGVKEACKVWSSKLGCPLSESTVRNFFKKYKKFSVSDQESMGKYAALYGLQKATEYYSKELGFVLKEGQMRKFKKLYLTRVVNLEELHQSEETKNSKTTSGGSCKRTYSKQMKEEIGQFAYELGISAAMQHFSEKLQFPVKESTVRKFRKLYMENTNQTGPSTSSASDACVVEAPVIEQQMQINVDGSVHTISNQSVHASIASSTVNVSGSNNFVYQQPYALNIHSGSNQPNLSSNNLSLNGNSFPVSGHVHQTMSHVPYPPLAPSSSTVIMNQNFHSQHQQQSSSGGGSNSFQPVTQNYITGYSAQLPVSSGPGDQGTSLSLSSQSVADTLQHTTHGMVAHPQHAPSLGQSVVSNNQQQSVHQLAQHTTGLQQPQLSQCYSGLTQSHSFENVSLSTEPLCLLKEPDPSSSGPQQVAQSIIPGDSSAITISESSSPINILVPVEHSAMTENASSNPDSESIPSDQSIDLEYSPPTTPGCSSRKKGRKRHRRRMRRAAIARRGNYVSYSPEVRAAIGKYAAEHGNLSAVKYFKEQLNIEIPESTVRGLKDKYINKKLSGKEEVTWLGFAQRGRPMRLGKYDAVVRDCIQELVRSGEKVSSFLVIATAKQVLIREDASLLEENGGPIKLNPTWAKSFLRRMGLHHM